MKNINKRYWKGIEEYRNDLEVVKNADREFNLEELDGGTHRRDFLKMLGFGMAAVSLAACDAPVRKTIPYLNKPEDIEPGIPNFYASTYTEGGDVLPILVKTREGRPIKIEGNPEAKFANAGISARAQASVLSLYDIEKLQGPVKGDAKISWEDLDKEVSSSMAKASNVVLVSSTISSPASLNLIKEFGSKYSGFKHVQYDANSTSALLEANLENFGTASIPMYNFDKASVIVGVNCDFLGTWVSPEQFSAQWADGRRLSSAKDGKKSMSRHYQFETGMSITGAAADYRGMIKPSEEVAMLAALYSKIASAKGLSTVNSSFKSDLLDKSAKDLLAAGPSALVVSGSNNKVAQLLVNAINASLGAYGTTLSFEKTINTRKGMDAEMGVVLNDLKGGKIDAILFWDCNPVYTHAKGAELAEAIKKAKVSISFNAKRDETGQSCTYVAPAPHFLESWGDAEMISGFYTLMQPTISKIFKTRQVQDSLLTWSGSDQTFDVYLENFWKNNLLSGTGITWEKALHDGFVNIATTAIASNSNSISIGSITVPAAKEGLEAHVFENIAVGTGVQANNPWLQELPDPISKVTWENTAAVSQKTANALGLAKGDIVKVTAGSYSIELPVLIQPGQAHDTVSIAMGYGRTFAGKSGNVGVNANPLIGYTGSLNIEKTNDGYTLAQTQTHETVMGRSAVVQESVLSEYVKNPKAGRFEPHVESAEGTKRPYAVTLWNGHEKKNHSWGLVIDLNTCTGCSACLVACQAENNVAVVGKKEVVRAREMHWIRLDRYYSTDADTTYSIDPAHLREMEVASENPEVVMQPMMCQHCSNAPCETVCPVLATTHSSEGLNQMTYNRCVGTRYCANNCPYKVRRFNWWKYFENDEFDFHMNNELGRMVLNPDVTVRSRGVIEKCSMCVQRIQAGKLTAKKERRRPVDGEINTACAQTCPTGAITFGDMMDPNSEISKILEVEQEGRAFHVLEEINVRPQVSYLTKIRNKDEVKKSVEAHSAHS